MCEDCVHLWGCQVAPLAATQFTELDSVANVVKGYRKGETVCPFPPASAYIAHTTEQVLCLQRGSLYLYCYLYGGALWMKNIFPFN
jgi:hypothetical protein